MRDLYIDGRRVDMAAFVANNGTMAGRLHPRIREGGGGLHGAIAHLTSSSFPLWASICAIA